jgi:hypothetical protein
MTGFHYSDPQAGTGKHLVIWLLSCRFNAPSRIGRGGVWMAMAGLTLLAEGYKKRQHADPCGGALGRKKRVTRTDRLACRPQTGHPP